MVLATCAQKSSQSLDSLSQKSIWVYPSLNEVHFRAHSTLSYPYTAPAHWYTTGMNTVALGGVPGVVYWWGTLGA